MRNLRITTRVTNRDSLALEKYLSDVNRVKMVSLDEEVLLAGKIKEGDVEALDRLISANLRFVITVVKQYQNQGLPLQDLINEGNLGLIKAAQRFDPSKGFKFISYAVWWIRQSVLQALATHGRIVRLPLNKISLISKLKSTEIKLEQKFEREPTYDEIAEESKIDIENIGEINQIKAKSMSMDSPLNNNGEDEVTFYDILYKNDAESVESKLIKESISKELEVLLNKINEKERFIIKTYYGLDNFYPMTYGEIASMINLNAEQVRKIKTAAIRKLKRYSYELNYNAF